MINSTDPSYVDHLINLYTPVWYPISKIKIPTFKFTNWFNPLPFNPVYKMQCHVPEGGPVPKSLYKISDDELDRDKDRSPEDTPFTLDGLYHTAFVVRDFPHEVSGWKWYIHESAIHWNINKNLNIFQPVMFYHWQALPHGIRCEGFPD